ncbi:MAG: hypothetical protein V3U87_15965 [Methylococcaceae bacterium]
MLRYGILVFLIPILIIPAFAQESQISVYTNDHYYENGEIIVISGTINNYDPTSKEFFSFIVLTPDDNIATLGQGSPHRDGSFQKSFLAGGPLWKLAGDYVIDFRYGQTHDYVTINYVGGEYISTIPEPESTPEPTPTTTSISVQTDDNHYDEGDTIVISGNVNTVIGETPIVIHIIYESTSIHLAQIAVAQDNTFSETVIAEGSLWKNSGEYIVRASYQDQIAETEFDYMPKSESIETTTNFEVDAGSGTFDVEYSVIGGTVEDIIIDSRNFALIVQIDSTDEGTITLDLPREFIGSEKQDGKDDTFIILIDGIEIAYQESLVYPNSRVITLNFEEGDSEIKILGTYVIGSTGKPESKVPKIYLWTDKTVYNHNDNISVTGIIDILLYPHVTMTVLGPLNSLITADQLTLADDGRFETTVSTAGAMWKYDGTYTIKVNYGYIEKDIKFEVNGGVAYTPSYSTPTSNSIVITTDKTDYDHNDIINIEGEVAQLLGGYALSFRIIAPNGNIVAQDQLIVGADKKFRTSLEAGGALMKSEGLYTIRVQYGDNKNNVGETTFGFEGSRATPPTRGTVTDSTVSVSGSSDLIEYVIRGGNLLGITSDMDALSLIVSIDASNDGLLTLTIPRTTLDAKIDGMDTEFFILMDGEQKNYSEITSQIDRKIIISFSAGSEEIEIIGTQLFSKDIDRDQIISKYETDSLCGPGTFYDSKKNACVLNNPEKIILTQEMPNWVKNIFGWYAQDKVTEEEFLNAIKYLFDKKILIIN